MAHLTLVGVNIPLIIGFDVVSLLVGVDILEPLYYRSLVLLRSIEPLPLGSFLSCYTL